MKWCLFHYWNKYYRNNNNNNDDDDDDNNNSFKDEDNAIDNREDSETIGL